VKFWLDHPERWFNSVPENDRFLSDKFGFLLDDHPANDDDSDLCYSYILIFDQLARHIYRDDVNTVRRYHHKAYDLVLKHLPKWTEELSSQKLVWVLLVLRHSNRIEDITRCLQIVRDRPQWSTDRHLSRFYRVSVEKLGELLNESSNDSWGEHLSWENRDVVCDFVGNFSSIDECSFIDGLDSSVLPKKGILIISLSGGVDSMVLSVMLKKWCMIHSELELRAVHINYGNRETADMEEDFVRHWCRLIDIPITVRKISEIYRERTIMRDFYEKHTRNVRFNTYRKVGGPNAMVCLGHNRDDTVENIVSNIRKKRNFNELRGMSGSSEENGVVLIRPMLRLEKTQIIKYAHDNGVSYLCDSTPEWSDRGRMRDHLIPYLKGFDRNIISGLEWLCTTIKDLSEQLSEIHGEYMDTFVYEDTTVFVENKKKLSHEFWMNATIAISKHFGIPYPTRKSVMKFVSDFQRNSGTYNFSKHLSVIFGDDGSLKFVRKLRMV